MAQSGPRLEIAMSYMLRAGVGVAALLVLAGGILYLAQSSGPLPDYHHFHGAAGEYEQVGTILFRALHLESTSLIELGLLLLIATPIGRVVLGVVGFGLQKDWLYTAVSAIVLAVLLFSFFARR
jgi:uncharacterized membrane protein